MRNGRESVVARLGRAVHRRRMSGVPILQAIDQGLGIRAGGLARFTGPLVPGHAGVAMFMQCAADDFDERLKGHVVPCPQIQHALVVLRWRGSVGTFKLGMSAVHKAATMSTNCKSGSPGLSTSSVCMTGEYFNEIRTRFSISPVTDGQKILWADDGLHQLPDRGCSANTPRRRARLRQQCSPVRRRLDST